MLAKDAAAQRIGHFEVSPLAAEVVFAVIVNAPGIDETLVLAGHTEQRLAAVLEIGPQGRPAVAQEVGRKGPCRARRRLFDPQQLVQIPVEIKLLAEDAV